MAFLDCCVCVGGGVRGSTSSTVADTRRLSGFKRRGVGVTIGRVFSVVPAILGPIFPGSFIRRILRRIFSGVGRFTRGETGGSRGGSE